MVNCSLEEFQSCLLTCRCDVEVSCFVCQYLINIGQQLHNTTHFTLSYTYWLQKTRLHTYRTVTTSTKQLYLHTDKLKPPLLELCQLFCSFPVVPLKKTRQYYTYMQKSLISFHSLHSLHLNSNTQLQRVNTELYTCTCILIIAWVRGYTYYIAVLYYTHTQSLHREFSNLSDYFQPANNIPTHHTTMCAHLPSQCLYFGSIFSRNSGCTISRRALLSWSGVISNISTVKDNYTYNHFVIHLSAGLDENAILQFYIYSYSYMVTPCTPSF